MASKSKKAACYERESLDQQLARPADIVSRVRMMCKNAETVSKPPRTLAILVSRQSAALRSILPLREGGTNE
jgi:hypothetical protein